MKSYKDLDVYNRSYSLAIEIHSISHTLRDKHEYELSDQIKRASRSVPSNIAEGFGRGKSSKDTVNQLRTALGSADEMIFNIEFMRDVNLIDKSLFDKFFNEYTITAKQLFKLIESLEKSIAKDQQPKTNN